MGEHTDDDVNAAMALMARVAAMPDDDVVERRRVVMESLAELTAADTWMWIITQGLDQPNAIPVAMIDGGYDTDAQRSAVHRANTDPAWIAAFNRQLDLTRHTTVRFDPAAVPPEVMPDVAGFLAGTGFAHLMFSVRPLGHGAISGLGLHRKLGREPFAERDRDLLHLVASHVGFLHAGGTDVPANSPAHTGLSPRLSEALIHVLDGDGRKQIARKMNLSEHTVGDHLKAIYKHFAVNSRGELLAMFIGRGR